MINQTLSHYKIIEKLGAGGMGEVYRAEDTTLKRQVALKILPEVFAEDPERLARFQREAEVLASLNHPNIAAIHGLEEADGKRFLVLELVEGETLAERIKKGPLPVDEALEVCRQIAEGLESAHEKGVIHRDLKPANVKITPEGKVKILDFGLAKAFQEEPAATDLSHSPTITDGMTQGGVILGTAAYMSPEQAKGKPVDKRADIWAFGCVLFECLAARCAFEGETITETLAAILKGEPDWGALPAAAPIDVRKLIQRCLTKDLRSRFHDIADVRIELNEAASSDKTEVQLDQAVPEKKTSSTIGTCPGSNGVGGRDCCRSYPLQVMGVHHPEPLAAKFEIPLPYGLGLDRLFSASIAVSPDGSQVVFNALGPSGRQLYLRDLNALDCRPLKDTETAVGPFFSPDGNWIGYFSRKDHKLKKVNLLGGASETIADFEDYYGATWSSTGNIVFAPSANSGLYSVPAGGGKAVQISQPDPSADEAHLWPQGAVGSKDG